MSASKDVSILVVEDSPTQAERLVFLLEDSGYRVTAARNGREALVAVKASRPALIISDIMMPELDGFEMCYALKYDPSTQAIPVILLTSLSDVKDVLHALRARADYFITKPYDDDYLLSQVEYLLDGPLPLQVANHEAIRSGLEITFAGERFTVTSSRQQILSLLLSTYENAVRQNRELVGIQVQLETVNKQLSNTLSELERSNEDLEQFAYVASHDLQAPLRTIASYLQVLDEDHGPSLADDARSLVQGAVRSAMRMRELIQDLLAYSRVGSRQMPMEAVDLNGVLQEAVENLRSVLDETGAQLTFDQLPSINGDRIHMVQLFQNLLGNGVKFRRQGVTPKLHIGVERNAEGWCFAVSDNGIGIAREHLERIFVIFQRLHPEGSYPGSGIGLAICKKIVERHRGRIWVESQPGEGTTFRFTLPR
jgi:signal transduction histidine kinase